MKKIFFLFFFFCVLASPFFAFAEDIFLNVPIGEQKKVSDFSEYVALWYNFVLGTVGIIAAVMIMWGGFRWLTSRGEPEAIKDAKERIIAAITGLVLAFLSFTILNLINPKLVKLKMPILPTGSSTQQQGTSVSLPDAPTRDSHYSGIRGCCSFVYDDGKKDCQGANSSNYCNKIKENMGDLVTSASFFADLYCNFNTKNCELKPAE